MKGLKNLKSILKCSKFARQRKNEYQGLLNFAIPVTVHYKDDGF